MWPYRKGCAEMHILFVILGGVNMSIDKPFMKIDDQIIQLKNRNLLFQSEESAKLHLIRYGYYEIVNGYKYHFMKDKQNDAEGFVDGTTFEHVYALFDLDGNLREQVMSSLEIFESNLRQVIAYTVAEEISEDQNFYIKRWRYNVGKSYWNRRRHRRVYPIDDLLSTLNSITHAQTEPYKHYREDHNNIPPWIVVKKLSFGNLIWWFKLLKKHEKNIVVSKMMGVSLQIVNTTPELSKSFSVLLALYLNYRNTAAHGGRIYNHKSDKYKLPYIPLLHSVLNVDPGGYRIGKGQSRLGVLLNTLNMFENKDPYNRLMIGLNVYINEYLKLFPDDENYLFERMELTHNDLK